MNLAITMAHVLQCFVYVCTSLFICRDMCSALAPGKWGSLPVMGPLYMVCIFLGGPLKSDSAHQGVH